MVEPYQTHKQRNLRRCQPLARRLQSLWGTTSRWCEILVCFGGWGLHGTDLIAPDIGSVRPIVKDAPCPQAEHLEPPTHTKAMRIQFLSTSIVNRCDPQLGPTAPRQTPVDATVPRSHSTPAWPLLFECPRGGCKWNEGRPGGTFQSSFFLLHV